MSEKNIDKLIFALKYITTTKETAEMKSRIE